MTDAPVGADLHQALDVHADLAAEVALDGESFVHRFADTIDLFFGQVVDARIGINARRLDDLLRAGRPYAVDIRQGYFHPLVAGNVYAGNTCHENLPLALSLLVLRVAANYHNRAPALDDFALRAARLYRCSYLHFSISQLLLRALPCSSLGRLSCLAPC